MYGNNDKSDIYNQFDLDNAFAGESNAALRAAEGVECRNRIISAYDTPAQQQQHICFD